jgi:hypothetical protein
VRQEKWSRHQVAIRSKTRKKGSHKKGEVTKRGEQVKKNTKKGLNKKEKTAGALSTNTNETKENAPLLAFSNVSLLPKPPQKKQREVDAFCRDAERCKLLSRMVQRGRGGKGCPRLPNSSVQLRRSMRYHA